MLVKIKLFTVYCLHIELCKQQTVNSLFLKPYTLSFSHQLIEFCVPTDAQFFSNCRNFVG